MVSKFRLEKWQSDVEVKTQTHMSKLRSVSSFTAVGQGRPKIGTCPIKHKYFPSTGLSKKTQIGKMCDQ